MFSFEVWFHVWWPQLKNILTQNTKIYDFIAHGVQLFKNKENRKYSNYFHWCYKCTLHVINTAVAWFQSLVSNFLSWWHLANSVSFHREQSCKTIAEDNVHVCAQEPMCWAECFTLGTIRTKARSLYFINRELLQPPIEPNIICFIGYTGNMQQSILLWCCTDCTCDLYSKQHNSAGL